MYYLATAIGYLSLLVDRSSMATVYNIFEFITWLVLALSQVLCYSRVGTLSSVQTPI